MIRILRHFPEHRRRDLALVSAFLRDWLRAPRKIGAVWPSSRRLARSMAAMVPAECEGYILELGAGTGVVTEALLKRKIDPARIVLVEQSRALVDMLHKKFPDIHTIHGDATQLHIILPEALYQPGAISAVVSSLPLRSLPAHTSHTILAHIENFTKTSGRYIQFTYDLGKTEHAFFSKFHRRFSRIVWRNIPPAKIHVFEKFYENSRKPENEKLSLSQ